VKAGDGEAEAPIASSEATHIISKEPTAVAEPVEAAGIEPVAEVEPVEPVEPVGEEGARVIKLDRPATAPRAEVIHRIGSSELTRGRELSEVAEPAPGVNLDPGAEVEASWSIAWIVIPAAVALLAALAVLAYALARSRKGKK
jgi:hypothetical protein